MGSSLKQRVVEPIGQAAGFIDQMNLKAFPYSAQGTNSAGAKPCGGRGVACSPPGTLTSCPVPSSGARPALVHDAVGPEVARACNR